MRQLPADAAGGSGSGLVGLLHNGAFVAAFLGFFFAQSAKVFTHYYTERKWDFTRLVSSGGMPSSHTALVREEAAGVAEHQLEGACSHFLLASLHSSTQQLSAASCCRPCTLLVGQGTLQACLASECGCSPAAAACLPRPLPAQPTPPRLRSPPQVMGLTTAIGVLEGTNHPMFAISLVFSLIVSPHGAAWLC